MPLVCLNTRYTHRLTGLVLLLVLLAGCATGPKSTAPTPAPGAHEQAEEAYRAKDYAKARRILEPLAEQGDATAQYILGYMYYYGQGVASNPALARVWIERAADQGHNKARVALTQLDQAQQEQEQTQAAARPRRASAAAEPMAAMESGEEKGSEDPEAPSMSSTMEPPVAMSDKAQASAQPAPWDKPDEMAQSTLRADEWVLTQPAERYTIQLLAVGEEQAVIDFIQDNKLQAEAAYYHFTRQGKRWFAVVYGSYENSADARLALSRLDRKLRNGSPWIRRFEAIQSLSR